MNNGFGDYLFDPKNNFFESNYAESCNDDFKQILETGSVSLNIGDRIVYCISVTDQISGRFFTLRLP